MFKNKILVLTLSLVAIFTSALEINAEKRESFKVASVSYLDPNFVCNTKNNGIQGCWRMPFCINEEGVSHREILEFTLDGFIKIHRWTYTNNGCKNSNLISSSLKDRNSETLLYDESSLTITKGMKSVAYQKFSFSRDTEWIVVDGKLTMNKPEGSIAFHIKDKKLCFLPSQITTHGFLAKANNMDEELSDKDYFLNKKHIKAMSKCLPLTIKG